MRRLTYGAVAAAALVAGSPLSAQTLEPGYSAEPDWNNGRGFSLRLDNDLFSGAHRDEDYSWGAAFTYAAPQPNRVFAPFDRAREHLDGWVGLEDPQDPWLPQIRAVQFGILAMTPSTLRSAEPLYDDRPYANLIFLTSSRMRVLERGDTASFSSLTVGVLGLQAAETLHRAIHKVVGDESPLGWEHQISNGGEPTARYVLARQWLLTGPEARSASFPELKFTMSGSAGFLTEGTVAFSGRWGRLQTPWWSFAPELGDYTAAPLAPVTQLSSANPAEWFVFAGFRLKARAYNALLQGQFRHSDVRVAAGDLARWQAEAWMGLASTISNLRITYGVHYTSTEVRREPAKRGLIWAGISFEKSLY